MRRGKEQNANSVAMSLQPSQNLILDRPHGPTLHYSQALMNFETGHFAEVQPVAIDQFSGGQHEIGICRGEYFNADTKVTLREDLRLKIGSIFRIGRPAKDLQCWQTGNKYAGFATAKLKMFVMPVYGATILKNFNRRIAAIERFYNRKIRVLLRTSRLSLAMRAVFPEHAGIQRAPFVRQSKILPEALVYSRSRRFLSFTVLSESELDVFSFSEGRPISPASLGSFGICRCG